MRRHSAYPSLTVNVTELCKPIITSHITGNAAKQGSFSPRKESAENRSYYGDYSSWLNLYISRKWCACETECQDDSAPHRPSKASCPRPCSPSAVGLWRVKPITSDDAATDLRWPLQCMSDVGSRQYGPGKTIPLGDKRCEWLLR